VQAAALTRQLLSFSSRQVLQPRVLDLSTVVAGVEKMLRRLIGEDIHLICVPGRALGKVKADPTQIEQVLMNLAVNSRDAMPEGGTLTIKTRNIAVRSHPAGEQKIPPGEYLMLAVRDTGIGMSEEVKAHLFEPFFTTKPKGRGTGLG